MADNNKSKTDSGKEDQTRKNNDRNSWERGTFDSAVMDTLKPPPPHRSPGKTENPDESKR